MEKPTNDHKFKFEFGKNISNVYTVYYACDGVVGTCAGLVLYDHHKGGKPSGYLDWSLCDDFWSLVYELLAYSVYTIVINYNHAMVLNK